LAHRLGRTLTPQAVAAKTHESTAVETVGSQVVVAGRVGTMAALLTQRQGAQTLVTAGGASLRSVTEHQPPRKAASELVFTRPPAGDRQERVRTVDVGQGRIETRTLTTRAALVGDSAWPGLAPVGAVGRHVITKKTGAERAAVVYGGTSRSPERATPGRGLALVRGHGALENKSHWGREVPCDEDRSHVRCGHIPQGRAPLRHTAIGLLRWAGHTNMAAACRRLAAQPVQALALSGIEFEN
jgi:hypothetical protein